MNLYRGRTIIGKSVVEFRGFYQVVHRFEIILKEVKHLVFRCFQAIRIYPFFSEISPQPDDIAFVCCNIGDFILFEKTMDCRVLLGFILSCFDGNRQIPVIAEIPAENRE